MRSFLFLLVWLLVGSRLTQSAAGETIDVRLRYQQPTLSTANRFYRLTRQEQWPAEQVAVIVCDMWDSHTCVGAVRRVQELAPRIDQLVGRLRSQGATIIHAPSSCMQYYQDHSARKRTTEVATASQFPGQIENWCDQIPSEQSAAYPLDQSEGGNDDDAEEKLQWERCLIAQGRNPRSPWTSQNDKIQIDGRADYISDSGPEIWSILQSRKISHVLLVGVHTNMCVLGRPFGLRRLASAGMQVALVRDLTDTMYDSRAWPYASHFTGTDLIISHIERYVCPTISSDQILGGREFRFSADRRPHLLMLIAEDEYRTEETLPDFAAKHLSQHFRVSYALGSQESRHQIHSLEELNNADALLVSVRRRPLPEAELQRIKLWVDSGRPLIGIRTASHPFTLRSGKVADGLSQWPEFDQQAWGGNYTGHFGNQLKAQLSLSESGRQDAIVKSLGTEFVMRSGGSLYKTAPLAAGTRLLISGQIEGEAPEPVAWTYIRADGGRSFYTSLGHVDDFAQDQFETLLAAGIHWACNLPIPSHDSIVLQNQRYSSGAGRQRK